MKNKDKLWVEDKISQAYKLIREQTKFVDFNFPCPNCKHDTVAREGSGGYKIHNGIFKQCLNCGKTFLEKNTTEWIEYDIRHPVQ